MARPLKIDKYYRYKEVPERGGKISFGWEAVADIVLSQKLVLSYPSKSSKVTDLDIGWSHREGVSATSFDDYVLFFKALTGNSPSDFDGRWSDVEDQLEGERRLYNKSYREDEGKFLLNLSKLLSGKTERFSQYSRVFKAVDGAEYFGMIKSDKG